MKLQENNSRFPCRQVGQKRFRWGKRVGQVVAVTMLLGSSAVKAERPLVTGRRITPRADVIRDLGSLPVNLIGSPDGRFAISTDMGSRESLRSIDTSSGRELSRVEFNRDHPNPPSNGLYYGLAISPTGTLYAAQGHRDQIAVLQLSPSGILTQTGAIETRPHDFPAGLALDNRGYLYVANNDPLTFQLPGSVTIYSTATAKEVGRYRFASSSGGTPNFPLAIAALGTGQKCYVASERDGAVYVIGSSNPTNPALLKTIPTGAHPDALLLSRDQHRLYVANAQSDTVSVVDTGSDAVLNTILLRPSEAEGLPGVTPTGLALSHNGSLLYVSLGDLSAVAVVDTRSGALKGYLPAGWYPSAVLVSPDDRKLLICNAKGVQTRNPNPGFLRDSDRFYVQNIIEGDLLMVLVPEDRELDRDTRTVIRNAGLDKPERQNARELEELQQIGLKAGKIQHVIYVIKENRTYDQVLGDMKEGNGDPSLTLFGEAITPNQHALARRFVLLDNFYDCGEVSGDGWPWSTEGVANEYVVRNIPYDYSGRGRNYDYEGQNNGYLTGGFPAKDPDGKSLSKAHPDGLPPIPDVTEPPNGHLWDLAERGGLSYRNFGLFYSDGVSGVLPDNYPSSRGIRPPGHDLSGISDYDYRRFDLSYPESDAPEICFRQSGNANCLYPLRAYGRHRSPDRFSEWKQEFQEMLERDPRGGAVPTLMTVRFPEDHTRGLAAGAHSPRSYVADNDYAVGQLVETVSRSPIWKSTAIFIVEDDAQDGADHVDAHRSTCYVISPWIRKNSVDHRFYNTDSVLKSMEMLLGLPPLSQYDAIARPIRDWSDRPSNDALYTAVMPAASIIAERNPPLNTLNKQSELYRLEMLAARMDFAHPDSAPADLVNAMIWKSVKGMSSAPPAPRHKLGTS